MTEPQRAPLTILHTSDMHGPMPFGKMTEPFDVLCDSGDWLPEPPRASRGDIARAQMEFLTHEGPALAAHLDGRPFVGCLGNHCVLTERYVEAALRHAGVQATYPGHHGAEVLGRLFFGVREVPLIGAGFVGESTPDELADIVCMLQRRWSRSAVLLAHCPPAVPHLCERPTWGNPALLGALLVDPSSPGLVLTGHIHECGGRSLRIGHSLVVNHARTFGCVVA